MSFLFSRRDKVDVPPVRVPKKGGRTRMAGERPFRSRRRRSEERQSSIEEAFEKRRRGRRESVPPTGERGPRGPREPRGPRGPRGPKPEGTTPVRGPGFSCPDPSMHILMANGLQKKAGELVVGDVVSTYHEKDLEKASKKSLVLASGGTEKHSQLRDQLENSYAKATLGEYKVEFVDIVKDVEKIKLTFEGSEIICSLTHNFYVNDSWKEAKDMVIGDEVSDKKLVAIEDVENGDVVHITIEDAHTYICEDLLSHNKRRPPNKGGRRPIKRGDRRDAKLDEFDRQFPVKTFGTTGGRGPRRDPPRGERGGRGGRRPLPPGIGDPRIAPGPDSPLFDRPSVPRFPQMTEEERQKFMDMCPDPNMNILMADGSQKRAGDLVVGDLVKTYHEKDLEKTSKKSLVLASGGAEKYLQLREQLETSYSKATLGEYKVEFVNIIKDVKKIKLTFEGSEIICSLSHKFYANNTWKKAKDMVIGDEVSGKKLVSIESVEDGDVVQITIEDAHTYICEGLLSHNKGLRPGQGRGKRGGRRRRRRRRRREPDPRAINVRPRPKRGIAPTSDSPLFDKFPMVTPRFR